MKKWGIGIEHEMRVRFKDSIFDLKKDIISKYFPNFKNEYIFIYSNLLLYYYDLYEVIIMKNFKKYYNGDDANKNYTRNILLKEDLLILAKNKKPYPIKDNNYFNINDMENSLNLLEYYLMVYSLYHSPLLFFSYDYEISLKEMIKEINIDNNIINNKINNKIDNKVDIIKEIEYNLNNLYNGAFELQTYNYLKNKFNKEIIKFYSVSYDDIHQNIIFEYDQNNKNINKINKGVSFEEFINSINGIIDAIRNIFNNDVTINDIGYSKFYKNLYILYSNKIPHIDTTNETSSIEFKTINYENMNYEKALNDLIELEKTFFYLINNLPIFKPLTDIFGDLIYHNIGSVKNTICIYDIFNISHYTVPEDYTGSYHIWITAPYPLDLLSESSMKTFINIHVDLANKLQLLEPILASHYTSPSYDALNNSESDSSLRQFLNNYSNYGTSDVTLMYGTKNHIVDKYYLSEKDIYNNKRFIPQPYSSQIYDNKGKNILNYDKLNTRRITNNIFKQIDKGDNESNNKINVQNYYTMIFEKTDIRPKKSLSFSNKLKYFDLGADIRTRDLSNYIYPLDKNWSKCLLMKKNKLIEVYYNKKLQKISYNRVFNKDEHKRDLLNKIGIEFRIFDHFPTSYLNQILALLVPVVLDSTKNTHKKIQFKNTYITKQFWHDEMFNIIMKGYDYKFGIKYLNALEKEFDIKLENKNSFDSSALLKTLYEKISFKHKGTLYDKMRFHSKINFFSFNKKAWLEIINKFFQSRPLLLQKIMYMNKDLSDKDIINMLGYQHNYDLTKIKNYLEDIN